MTLVLTATDMFLATENFQQWPIPHLQDLPRKQDLNPPYLDVQCMEITDIEQIVSDRAFVSRSLKERGVGVIIIIIMVELNHFYLFVVCVSCRF